MPKDREEKISVDSQGRILLFGRPVGTIRKGAAVVDSACQLLELNRFLMRNCRSVCFQVGIAKKLEYDELMAKAHLIHRARVYQLRAEVDPTLKFISYTELMQQTGCVDPSNYHTVFDGDVKSSDAEVVYRQLRDNPPKEYTGHALTRSDVLELYNPKESRFFYVDTFALKEIQFEK